MTDVSQEYAMALYSLARESQQDFREELTAVAGVFRDNPLYTDMLASPSIPIHDRTAAVREAFGSAVSDTVCSFIQLLCRRGHIRQLPACIDAYIQLEQAMRQHSVAKVISAVPLTEAETARLQQKLEKISGHTVALQCETDPALLGGAIVQMDGKVLDGTLHRRLHDMKEGIDR